MGDTLYRRPEILFRWERLCFDTESPGVDFISVKERLCFGGDFISWHRHGLRAGSLGVLDKPIDRHNVVAVSIYGLKEGYFSARSARLSAVGAKGVNLVSDKAMSWIRVWKLWSWVLKVQQMEAVEDQRSKSGQGSPSSLAIDFGFRQRLNKRNILRNIKLHPYSQMSGSATARSTWLRVSSQEFIFNYTQIILFLRSHHFGECSHLIFLYIIGNTL